MSTSTSTAPERTGELAGQTVVVLGGSSGIGWETARLAHAAGADLVVTGRDAARLATAADALDARSATLDLGDAAGLPAFFAGLPAAIDHVLVSGGGPAYAPLAELDDAVVARNLDEHLIGALRIARECASRVRPGGSLTLISGTHARRPGIGLVVAAIGSAAIPALAANLALEIAPVRVNAIAAGFVDTPLSARLLGADLDARRAELAATLPIGRVVGPADIAATALHLMTNEAITGATLDVDGGQQLVRG
jgi:NAD(P)-dependent dehydrogenase (short-subunit alcohol dehydrogenase family)